MKQGFLQTYIALFSDGRSRSPAQFGPSDKRDKGSENPTDYIKSQMDTF